MRNGLANTSDLRAGYWLGVSQLGSSLHVLYQNTEREVTKAFVNQKPSYFHTASLEIVSQHMFSEHYLDSIGIRSHHFKQVSWSLLTKTGDKSN